MATRKRTPQGTGSLFASMPPAKPLPKPEAMHGYADQFGGEDFPSDTSVVEERKLRIVPPPATTPESEVIIEPTGDGRYVVSLLRDHGTTVACVKYTRAQLEMLLRRIPAALEVG